jgi:acetyltransferase-like isoleucine patch superfamily enzyme
MQRRLELIKVNGNSMQHWWKIKNPLKIVFNFLLIYLARFLPSTRLKNFLYRICGAKIEDGVTFGLGAVIDIFYPELITIRKNTIIGYNTTIICHEFLQNEYRTGKVEIGENCMIGANCLILPGIKIGKNAKIGAFSLVNKDVPDGEFWAGVPAKKVKK